MVYHINVYDLFLIAFNHLILTNYYYKQMKHFLLLEIINVYINKYLRYGLFYQGDYIK
jgi:hypothetical protein